MKKYVLLLTLLFLIVVSIFLFKDSQKNYTSSKTVACSPDAVSRLFLSTENWSKWLPGKKVNDSTYEIYGNNYRIEKVLLNGFHALQDEGAAIDFSFTPAVKNETQLNVSISNWEEKNILSKAWNLITKKDQRTADKLLNDISSFFAETKNVYGIDIIKGRVEHIYWVSTQKDFDHLPNTEETYKIIDTLEKFLAAEQLAPLGQPILHIRPLDEKSFQLMTALPVERPIQPTDLFRNKSMAPGFLLKADVKGGLSSIEASEREMENYARDNHKQSPAIPYQLLVTDRRKEADTT
ncbi:MAG: hypothetical protein ACK5B4_00275, partial [Bacteroidota bacterium]